MLIKIVTVLTLLSISLHVVILIKLFKKDPEKKIKPVKAISFKVNKDLYLQIEKIANENNLSIGQYAKKILLEKIESTK